MPRIEGKKMASNYLVQCQKEREVRVEVGLVGVFGHIISRKVGVGVFLGLSKQIRMQRNKRDVEILKDEFLVIKLCILESPWHTFGGFNR
ncbi:hypothetical protein HYC85_028722 [Camellia sinensis]|uniref:Uncharacterized protein n=1 Tax=Camellia sinensis TaxID=4442 RepID=A0A7J7FX41_CAMSI|nr:hypothetical protein HYC85_028722 [Camellia sinensis]